MVYNRESSLLRVIEVPLDSPSHRAGLRSGDIIVSIDGLPTSRMKLSEILEALRGPVGSKVRLFILRGKKYHRIIVERAPYSRR
jgi:carboxyl-terminal processing protease